MHRCTLKLPDDLYDRLSNRSKVLKCPTEDLALEILSQSEQKEVVVDSNPTVKVLDEACRVLLRFLPEEVSEFLYSQSIDEGRPLAAYVLSQLHLMRERGESSYVMGEYLDIPGLVVPKTSRELEPTRCEWCSAVFQPENRGQRFCPPKGNDTPDCGWLAHEEEVRKRQRIAPPSPFDPGLRSEGEMQVHLQGARQTGEVSESTPMPIPPKAPPSR